MRVEKNMVRKLRERAEILKNRNNELNSQVFFDWQATLDSGVNKKCDLENEQWRFETY